MDENLKFRALTANEVEVRLNKVYGDKGLYLLYKDARVDMNILDEVFTPWGWQREHREMKGVIYCGVSIKSPDGEWITKWDAGAESNTEKEKGEASDSFKRACFNWGIGRELYTAPTIRIPLTKDEIDKQKGNIYGKVTNMQVENGKITALEIVDGKGNVRFTMGKQQLPNKPVELKQPAPSAKKVTTNADIERQRQDLITIVESCDSLDNLKKLYNENESIMNDFIKSKFTARKLQLQTLQTA